MNGASSPADRGDPARILHVTPSFFPATRFGGPIFSTKAICDWVAARPGVALHVLTTDAAGPARGDRLSAVQMAEAQPADYAVRYCRASGWLPLSLTLLFALPGSIRRADLVHLTATYSFTTLPTLALARLLGKPVVWSPRGAIQATAQWRDAPRRGLKRLFERLARRLAPGATVLHLTAREEADATGARMPGMALAIIPNSVALPPAPVRRPAPGRVRLMFLSRIHEKKGLDLLLAAMTGLPDPVELTIYGTGAPDYLARLRGQVAALGLEGRVTFAGHVDGAEKADAFARADLFVLPSHSENFGIVVAEALAHGVPVVTTDRTPWHELEARGCGLCVPADAAALRDAIARLCGADLPAMGAAGRAWVKACFAPDATHGAMLDLYRALLAAGDGHAAGAVAVTAWQVHAQRAQ